MALQVDWTRGERNGFRQEGSWGVGEGGGLWGQGWGGLMPTEHAVGGEADGTRGRGGCDANWTCERQGEGNGGRH